MNLVKIGQNCGHSTGRPKYILLCAGNINLPSYFLLLSEMVLDCYNN